MRINVVKTLIKKEFLNIIRDRKSFIIMILLPLLMFPLLIGLMGVLLSTYTKIDNTIKLGINYEITDDFKEFIDSSNSTYKFEIVYETEEELKEDFDNGDINIYVIKDNNTYNLHFDQNDSSNLATNTLVETMYEAYQEHYISDKLGESGIDYEALQKEFEIKLVQESVTEMGSFLPSIISMALVMIITSVAFSVAIDITTSEKEKGTLETLLSLPIKKHELITSKYIVVFCLSCLSGILAYISLFGTLIFAKSMLSMLGVSSIVIDFKVLLIFLVAIILISLLFSGLLLSITVFSKNLKEAQNSLYPMELIVTFVSMLPMLGIKASVKYALIPFVNISLLFNSALASNIDVIYIILTLVSTLCYSLILINVVSKIYNQEDILFNTKSMNYLIFDKGKKKTICFSPLTSIVIAVVAYLLALYFSIMFITSSKYLLIAITPLTLLFVVIVSSLIVKIDFKKSFKLNKFKIRHMYIFFLLYIGLYIFANYLVDVVSTIFPSIVSDYSVFGEYLTVDNLWLGLLLIALLPAIAEELMFRGVIFNSFNKKYGVAIGIFVSALIFGIYHMNWVQGIFAFVMGIGLAYGYYKTGSIYTSIIIHFINNAFSVICDHFNLLTLEFSYIGDIIMLFFATVIVCSCVFMFEKELDK